jgi:hypothetical protein
MTPEIIVYLLDIYTPDSSSLDPVNPLILANPGSDSVFSIIVNPFKLQAFRAKVK